MSMGTHKASRTRFVRAGGALAAMLAAASVFVAAPAGASNQDVTFTVTPIFFGSVVLGTSSTGQSIVTNTTAEPLYFISASPSNNNVGAEYHASQGTCTGALASGAQCQLSVVFAPNAKGLRASTLAVRFGEHDAHGNVSAAATVGARLQGHGTPPTFTLTGGSAGNVALKSVGSVSATITNTSTVPLTLHGAHLSNVVNHDFAITATTCPNPVLPGGSCSIVGQFAPKRLGNASSTLSASMLVAGTKASLVGRQATLSGTGVTVNGHQPPFEMSALDLGQVTVGTSATGTVVLTNTSLKNETFASALLESDASHAYSIAGNTCTGTIAPAGTCDFTIDYAPAAAVTHNAALVVRMNIIKSVNVSVQVAEQTSLTGKGVNPTFTLAPSSFSSTEVGATSNGTVTVTNTSLVPLNYSATAFQGSDQSSWSQVGNACTTAIAPGESCSLEIAFSPHVQGTLAITIQVTLDLTVRSHTQYVSHRHALSGKATLPPFTISAPSLPSTPKGVAVTGTATVTNTSGVSLGYDGYGISGPNAGAFSVIATTCSGLIAPTGNCTLTVQFKPGGNPGTKTASLKVILKIAGLSATTAKSVAISGTES
jgi:hypothetical protein